jgi:hypothetical protein
MFRAARGQHDLVMFSWVAAEEDQFNRPRRAFKLARVRDREVEQLRIEARHGCQVLHVYADMAEGEAFSHHPSPFVSECDNDTQFV